MGDILTTLSTTPASPSSAMVFTLDGMRAADQELRDWTTGAVAGSTYLRAVFHFPIVKTMLLGQRCATDKKRDPPEAKAPKDYVPVAKDYDSIRAMVLGKGKKR